MLIMKNGDYALYKKRAEVARRYDDQLQRERAQARHANLMSLAPSLAGRFSPAVVERLMALESPGSEECNRFIDGTPGLRQQLRWMPSIVACEPGADDALDTVRRALLWCYVVKGRWDACSGISSNPDIREHVANYLARSNGASLEERVGAQ
jgi:hypothetical protein